MSTTNNAGEAIIPTLGAERDLSVFSKQVHLIDHLLRSIDGLIFLQLGVLYYSDNFTFLLLLRAVSQVLHVQIRSAPFGNIIQIPPVVVANIICLLVHVFHSRPEATGWASRGYIHGGILVDLVGELGPVPKWRLIILDIVVFALQLFMLALGYKKMKITDAGRETSTAPAQDLEAEEEGRLAGDQPAENRSDDSEQDNLLQSAIEGGHDSKSIISTEDDNIVLLEIQVIGNLRGLAKYRQTVPQNAAGSSTDAEIPNPRLSSVLRRIAAIRTISQGGS